jgi:hypothetical protein
VRTAGILWLETSDPFLYVKKNSNLSNQLEIFIRGKGGMILMPKAGELIKKYCQLQEEIEAFPKKRFSELFFSDESIAE